MLLEKISLKRKIDVKLKYHARVTVYITNQRISICVAENQ